MLRTLYGIRHIFNVKALLIDNVKSSPRDYKKCSLANKSANENCNFKKLLNNSHTLDNKQEDNINIFAKRTSIEELQFRKSVANSGNVNELLESISNFCRCELRFGAKNTVLLDGNCSLSGLLLIGEAPGEQEDLRGMPFCGQSGNLLNNILNFIGYKRDQVAITNTVFWRPPGNRQPSMEEYIECLPAVEKLIAILSPKLIVLLGATAARLINTNKVLLGAMRGETVNYSNQFTKDKITTVVTYHPSYLLRQPTRKREAMYDFLKIKQLLEKL